MTPVRLWETEKCWTRVEQSEVHSGLASASVAARAPTAVPGWLDYRTYLGDDLVQFLLGAVEQVLEEVPPI